MIKHSVTRGRRALKVVIELELEEAVTESQGRPEQYRTRIHSYMSQISKDILETLAIIAEEPDMRGTVKFFNDQKGWGMIRGYDSRDVFVHWKGIVGEGYRTLKPGQVVRFKKRIGREHTYEAVDVEVEPG